MSETPIAPQNETQPLFDQDAFSRTEASRAPAPSIEPTDTQQLDDADFFLRQSADRGRDITNAPAVASEKKSLPIGVKVAARVAIAAGTVAAGTLGVIEGLAQEADNKVEQNQEWSNQTVDPLNLNEKVVVNVGDNGITSVENE